MKAQRYSPSPPNLVQIVRSRKWCRKWFLSLDLFKSSVPSNGSSTKLLTGKKSGSLLFGFRTQVSTKSIPLCVFLAFIVLFMPLGVQMYVMLPKKARDTGTYTLWHSSECVSLGRPSMYKSILSVLAHLCLFVWVVFCDQSQIIIHKRNGISLKNF